MPGPSQPLVVTHSYTSSGITFLEHVIVELSLSFPDQLYTYDYEDDTTVNNFGPGAYTGNIQVELTSPAGTQSVILPYRPYDVTSNGYSNYQFLSVLHWGENPNGQWNLTFLNQNQFENGTLQVTIHNITLYGTDSTPQSVSSIPSQCHESCDSSKGCGGPGPEHCDACANLRNAMTLECIDACPQGFLQRNNYCYDGNLPEVGCERRTNRAAVLGSFTMLTVLMGLVSLWINAVQA